MSLQIDLIDFNQQLKQTKSGVHVYPVLWDKSILGIKYGKGGCNIRFLRLTEWKDILDAVIAKYSFRALRFYNFEIAVNHKEDRECSKWIFENYGHMPIIFDGIKIVEDNSCGEEGLSLVLHTDVKITSMDELLKYF